MDCLVACKHYFVATFAILQTNFLMAIIFVQEVTSFFGEDTIVQPSANITFQSEKKKKKEKEKIKATFILSPSCKQIPHFIAMLGIFIIFLPLCK